MPKIYITPHKKIAILFTILTLIALTLTTFCLAKKIYKTTIIVSAKLEEVNLKTEKEIKNPKIIKKTKTLQKTFSPKLLVKIEDFATGKITIVNNSRQSIILVPNTRFQAENGLIYRLTKRVFIPARSKIRAKIKADEAGEAYDINTPTKFIIVNLAPILQEKIYGESNEPITGGLKKVGAITQKDIDEAKEKIKNTLYKKIIDEIKDEIGKKSKLAVRLKSTSYTCDSKPGEEKSNFNIKIKMEVIAVEVDEDKLFEFAKEKLSEKIGEGKKLYSVEKSSFQYRLKNYNPNKNIAIVEIQVKGKSIISENNSLFKKENFVNLTADEIRTILSKNPLIQGVKVEFSPFYMKRSPKSPKKIKFKIQTLNIEQN